MMSTVPTAYASLYEGYLRVAIAEQQKTYKYPCVFPHRSPKQLIENRSWRDVKQFLGPFALLQILIHITILSRIGTTRVPLVAAVIAGRVTRSCRLGRSRSISGCRVSHRNDPVNRVFPFDAGIDPLPIAFPAQFSLLVHRCQIIQSLFPTQVPHLLPIQALPWACCQAYLLPFAIVKPVEEILQRA